MHNFESLNIEDTEKSIVDRFEAIVKLCPDNIAVTDQGEIGLFGNNCTYDFLNRTANKIARTIIARKPADDAKPLVLLLEQGCSQIVATLGVLKSGLFYIPMDPSNPLNHNKHMLTDSEVQFILTNHKNVELAKQLETENCQVLNIDTLDVNTADNNLNVAISPDTLSYVLYTSGSTGNPKGVIHNHRNVLHNVMRHTKAFDITPDDKQTLLYTSSVYGGQRDMFNALLNGASLYVYVVKNEGINGLAEWLQKNDISIYCSVATVFRMLVKTLENKKQFPKLRQIKLGGEATYKNDVDSYKTYFSDDCILHCGLGSTETGLVRNNFVNKHTVISSTTVALGYPIEDLGILLLNESKDNVAVGEIGEIVIQSKYIALGYWQNPTLTSAVFTTMKNGFRQFYTGDLGYINQDQCLVHRGRKDFQIKIKGNRVEVAAIEIALLRQSSIKEALVIGWKDNQGVDKLVAYIVAENQKPTNEHLRKILSESLPEYMLPSFFIWIAEMPLLPNGKRNRQALPDPSSITINETSYVRPQNKLQRNLTHIWEAVFDKPKIGINDDFFELGGDSLTAVLICAAIEKEIGVKIPISILVNNSQIALLAELINARTDYSNLPVLVPFNTIGDKPPLFCVHGILGGTFFYKKLLKHLDQNQPLYGLQPQSINGKYFKQNSIEALALEYIQEIKTVQSEGSYLIGGFSFGGLIAYQIARQLKEEGKDVKLLVIFDSSIPDRSRFLDKEKSKKTTPLPTHISKITAKQLIAKLKPEVGKKLYTFKHKFNSSTQQIKGYLRHLSLKFGSCLPILERDEYIAWNLLRLARHYNPQPYNDNILLFYTPDRQDWIISAWESYTSATIESYRIPGQHLDIFDEPGLEKMVNHLNAHLNKIEA